MFVFLRISLELKNKFESSMVHKPLVFKSLKIFCRFEQNSLLKTSFIRTNGSAFWILGLLVCAVT